MTSQDKGANFQINASQQNVIIIINMVRPLTAIEEMAVGLVILAVGLVKALCSDTVLVARAIVQNL